MAESELDDTAKMILIIFGIASTAWSLFGVLYFTCKRNKQPVRMRKRSFSFVQGVILLSLATSLTYVTMYSQFDCVWVAWLAMGTFIVYVNIVVMRLYGFHIIFRIADSTFERTENERSLTLYSHTNFNVLGSSDSLRGMSQNEITPSFLVHPGTPKEMDSFYANSNPLTGLNSMDNALVEELKKKRRPLKLLLYFGPFILLAMTGALYDTIADGSNPIFGERIGGGGLLNRSSTESCVNELLWPWTMGCVAVIYVIVVTYYILTLRGRQDGFLIRAEFFWIAFVASVLAPIILTLNVNTMFIDLNNQYSISTFVLFVGIDLFVWVSLVLPAWKTNSWKEPDFLSAPPANAVNNVQILLSFHEGRTAFRKYLRKTFEDSQDRYLNFWEQTQFFRMECVKWLESVQGNEHKTEEFVLSAREEAKLVDTWYLQFDAPYQVEINDRDGIMNEYFIQINRCEAEVRLADGGPIQAHEVALIFEDLAWCVMTDKLAPQYDKFYRSQEYRDLAKVLKDYQDIRMFRAACGLTGTGNEANLNPWADKGDPEVLPSPLIENDSTDIESPHQSPRGRKVRIDSNPDVAPNISNRPSGGKPMPGAQEIAAKLKDISNQMHDADTKARSENDSHLGSIRGRAKKYKMTVSEPPKGSNLDSSSRRSSFAGMKNSRNSMKGKRMSGIQHALLQPKKKDVFWIVVAQTGSFGIPVRANKSLGSKTVATLFNQERVRVIERSGRHLMIDDPFDGWVSWAAVDGGELLREIKDKSRKKPKSTLMRAPTMDADASSLEKNRGLEEIDEYDMELFLEDFRVGDLVEVRQFEVWRPGIVTSMTPYLKVKIELAGWNKSFIWPMSRENVRTLDHIDDAEYNEYLQIMEEQSTPRNNAVSVTSFSGDSFRQESQRQHPIAPKPPSGGVKHPPAPSLPAHNTTPLAYVQDRNTISESIDDVQLAKRSPIPVGGVDPLALDVSNTSSADTPYWDNFPDAIVNRQSYQSHEDDEEIESGKRQPVQSATERAANEVLGRKESLIV